MRLISAQVTMWLQTRVLAFGFFISMVLGDPTEQTISYPEVRMNVQCGDRYYSSVALAKTAAPACSRYEKQRNCRNQKSCSFGFLRPTKVSMYKGPYFPQYSQNEENDDRLLLWPLPRKRWLEKDIHFAVIQYDVRSKKCSVVGAIKDTDVRNHIECEKTEW